MPASGRRARTFSASRPPSSDKEGPRKAFVVVLAGDRMDEMFELDPTYTTRSAAGLTATVRINDEESPAPTRGRIRRQGRVLPLRRGLDQRHVRQRRPRRPLPAARGRQDPARGRQRAPLHLPRAHRRRPASASCTSRRCATASPACSPAATSSTASRATSPSPCATASRWRWSASSSTASRACARQIGDAAADHVLRTCATDDRREHPQRRPAGPPRRRGLRVPPLPRRRRHARLPGGPAAARDDRRARAAGAEVVAA